MPETIIARVKQNIPKIFWVCFYSAMAVGIIAHLYKITGWLPNWDSLVFRYDKQNMVGLGRWFLPVICSLSSFYDLPFLNGLLAIFYHSLGAVCICSIMKVKKNTTAALIGGVVASFPTVTAVMMYNYVADGYAFSFLLACLAAVCLTRERPRFCLAVILISLSVGIYQAYITVTIMLVLFNLINELVFEEKPFWVLLKKGLKIFISGALGMALYYIVLTVILKITGMALLDYQGFKSTTSMSNVDIWASLYVIKEAFINFFFDFSKGVKLYNVLNCVLFAVAVIGYLMCIIKYKSYKPWYKLLILAVFVILLPIGSTILAFINAGIDYHMLMKMGYCVFYILFVFLYEKLEFESLKKNIASSWVILALSFLLIVNQVVISNVSYHIAQISYEKSFGTLIRIADRIEQTEGVENCKQILVIGALEESEAYSVNLPPDMAGITSGYILRYDDESVGQSVLCSALNDYCGKKYNFIYGEQKQNLLKDTKIKQMSSWPSADSLLVKDDVLVIKLGEEIE